MKISHELPLALLDRAYELNDYDYCLPHLLDKYSAYKEFFLKAREEGRFIIMDNGLFEGVKHTDEDLIEKINLIKPDIFIVPDEWNDSVQTSYSATKWMNELKSQLPSETNLMVVLQGNSFNDFYFVYKNAFKDGYKHFAFNHSSKAYQHEFKHKNPIINSMMGRIDFITKFFSMRLFEPTDYIHLLGCSTLAEFIFYKGYPINSVDTSNPVILGLTGKEYDNDTVFTKPEGKIEEFMDKSLTDREIDDILYNIECFKDINA